MPAAHRVSNNGYEETSIDAWYEVRAVFANGTSSIGYLSFEDLTC